MGVIYFCMGLVSLPRLGCFCIVRTFALGCKDPSNPRIHLVMRRVLKDSELLGQLYYYEFRLLSTMCVSMFRRCPN